MQELWEGQCSCYFNPRNGSLRPQLKKKIIKKIPGHLLFCLAKRFPLQAIVHWKWDVISKLDGCFLKFCWCVLSIVPVLCKNQRGAPDTRADPDHCKETVNPSETDDNRVWIVGCIHPEVLRAVWDALRYHWPVAPARHRSAVGPVSSLVFLPRYLRYHRASQMTVCASI